MVGTVEDHVARRKAERDENGLDRFDRNLLEAGLGRACRLVIPFRDMHKMRQIAGKLRYLADEIERIAHQSGLKPREQQFLMRSTVRDISKEIEGVPGAGGRPTKVYDANGNNL